MTDIRDFVTGNSNRLLRDFLVASVSLMIAVAIGLVFLSHMLAPLQGGQPLPRTVSDSTSRFDTGVRNLNVVRSVLDDPVVTGSISNSRPIILDPCTGAEKSR
jgi:hypothetical protein